MRKSSTVSRDQVVTFLLKSITNQMARLLPVQGCFALMRDNVAEFPDKLRALAESKPLWGHFAKTARSTEDLWMRMAPTASAVEEIVSGLRLGVTPEEELSCWLPLLQRSGKSTSFAFLHTERLPHNVLLGAGSESVLSGFARFNLVLECNDSLKTIWTMCQPDMEFNVIEVPDLPKEAVKAVFVPSLLSDDVHVETVYSLCGGRVSLLQKLVSPLNLLNEEQRLIDQEQEQKYRSGKENRPSAESRELQVSPLVYKREVALRDSLVQGVLKADADDFQAKMDRVVDGFAPLVAARETISETEFKVLVCESIRQITTTLRTAACIPLPAGASPLEIAHPVILALLDANILTVSWVPAPRIVIESPLKLFLLESWCSAELDAMSLPQRTQYNLSLMRNKLNLHKQLEKLVA